MESRSYSHGRSEKEGESTRFMELVLEQETLPKARCSFDQLGVWCHV